MPASFHSNTAVLLKMTYLGQAQGMHLPSQLEFEARQYESRLGYVGGSLYHHTKLKAQLAL